MLVLFRKLKSYVLPMAVALLLSACGGSDKDETSSTERGALLSSQSLSEYNVSDTLALAVFSLRSSRSYDIDIVRLTYNTVSEEGDIVKASGTVALPRGKTGASPLLSYQHATIFLNSVVPGNDPTFDFTPILAASAGFVTVAPDYIGYGASSEITHPYIQAEPSANSVIDLIRAVRTYLKERDISLNNQLFLAGYSEGAYVSMAAHQRMEALYPEEFSVTASVIGGGPYDVRGTVDELLLNTSRINSPATIGYVVHAYDHYYDLDNLTLRAIASPHNQTVDGYYDGSRSGSAINSVLPRDTDELFDRYFLSSYAGIAGELMLKYKLDENNVYDWTPQAPIRLYHGQNDDVVPYANAIKAVSVMNENEAFDVTLTDCDSIPSTHVKCAAGFAKFALDELLDLSIDR